ncbi:MAG: alpha/beta fold hydrolase, partial [Cyanobacteria bacterium P01_F01_bin.143]
QESPIEILEVTANEMNFRCRVCGMDNNGESVILLHGFPETSHMWEKVMKFLASKGYRCLAPDQRGYSPEVADYVSVFSESKARIDWESVESR